MLVFWLYNLVSFKLIITTLIPFQSIAQRPTHPPSLFSYLYIISFYPSHTWHFVYYQLPIKFTVSINFSWSGEVASNSTPSNKNVNVTEEACFSLPVWFIRMSTIIKVCPQNFPKYWQQNSKTILLTLSLT